jgi:hypothetical protein
MTIRIMLMFNPYAESITGTGIMHRFNKIRVMETFR